MMGGGERTSGRRCYNITRGGFVPLSGYDRQIEQKKNEMNEDTHGKRETKGTVCLRQTTIQHTVLSQNV